MGQNLRNSGYLEMAQNGSKWPKIPKKWLLFNINAMKQIVVSQKTLRTYIPVKTIAKNIFREI